MTSLLSYGEALIDFLPNNNNSNYYPLAGGAPANVAVAFAKLGGKSYFAGGISVDNFGDLLCQQLEQHGVNTSYVQRIEQANTALVLVSLDKFGERSFNFYRHNTADMRYEKVHIDQIKWSNLSIFHFCSNTLTSTSMHDNTLYALQQAKQHNCLISFDVNLRQQLWAELSLLPKRVAECLALSHLVKFSKDEAEYLAAQTNKSYQAYLDNLLAIGVQLIVITDGANPVQVISASFSRDIEVPVINAIDTTAAGDSFIASFLCSITAQAGPQDIVSMFSNVNMVSKAVLFAASCGAYTCQQKGAFNALPTIHDIQPSA